MSPTNKSSSDVSDTGSASTTSNRYAGTVPSVTSSVELARVDIKRGIRWVLEQDFWILYGLVSAFGVLVGSWFAFNSGQDMGTALAAGESTWLSSTGMRMVWSTLWLFLTVLMTLDAVGDNGDLDNDGHYLTIRSAADIAGGKFLAAIAKFSAFVFIPVIAGYVGIMSGSGTFAPLVGGLVAATVTVVSAAAVGYPVGFTLKGLIRNSELLTSLKPVFAVVIGAGYVVVMTTGEFMDIVQRLEPVLTSPPLKWLGDLALVTTAGADVPVIGAVAAIVATTATLLAGVVLTVPASRYAWNADRVLSGGSEADETVDAPSHPVDRLVAAVSRRWATRSVATTTLLRVYRSPIQLMFVAIPLIGAIPIGEQLLETGSLPWYAPWLAVWYGAWAAGAAIPLNPLGNQGATLPSLLTAPADGRNVVHGNVVAATVPVALPVAALAVGLGHVEGRAGTELAMIAVASVVAVLAATVLAAGIGSVFPRFEAIDFAGSRQAVPPSKSAYSVFSTVLTVTVAAGAIIFDDTASDVGALLLSERLPFGIDVSASELTTVAWVVLGVVAISVPLAYRVAVRRIDGYQLS